MPILRTLLDCRAPWQVFLTGVVDAVAGCVFGRDEEIGAWYIDLGTQKFVGGRQRFGGYAVVFMALNSVRCVFVDTVHAFTLVSELRAFGRVG